MTMSFQVYYYWYNIASPLPRFRDPPETNAYPETYTREGVRELNFFFGGILQFYIRVSCLTCYHLLSVNLTMNPPPSIKNSRPRHLPTVDLDVFCFFFFVSNENISARITPPRTQKPEGIKGIKHKTNRYASTELREVTNFKLCGSIIFDGAAACRVGALMRTYTLA